MMCCSVEPNLKAGFYINSIDVDACKFTVLSYFLNIFIKILVNKKQL